ncbi:hypothetical protein [Kurthia senegalensis]|uniref:hypothetical protein n=1 Tax=Kurthia senegalensis TaxID=1033740 RepID=UPI0002881D85|nr:hypothetical protein [Kurthia senegalensis]
MKFIFFLLTAVSIIIVGCYSTVYTNIHTKMDGYEDLYLLPLVYTVLFLCILGPLLFYRFNTFLMSFVLVTFLRYVVLPFFIAKSQWYLGRSVVNPMSVSFDVAIHLMLWELICCCVLILLLFLWKRKSKPGVSSAIQLPKSMDMYVLFLIFAVAFLFISPQVIHSFAFISPGENLLDIGEGNFLTSIAQYVLITAKYFLFVMAMIVIYRRYQRQERKLWVILSFGIVLLNISIIYGDNRADFLIGAIASLYLFYRLYLKRAVPYIVFLVGIITLVLLNITSYRNMTMITSEENRAMQWADLLQIYAGGPYNVAIATELPYYFPQSATFANFIYDLFRPMMGFNLLFKNLEGFEFSNYLYNFRIFFTDQASQIMPMIGQGYFYSNFILSPFLSCSFILIAYLFIRLMNRSNRIELIFS